MPRPVRSLRQVVRRGVYEVTRSFREAEATWLVALIVMTLACVPLTWELREEWPLSGYVIPLLLAMNVLSFPRLVVLEVVLAACMGESLMLITVTPLRLVGLGVVLLAAIIVTLHVRSRARLGLLPLRGDSMLVDLRDRLASQSKLPVLPSPWHGEAVTRSAGGASFSGDFIVAARTHQAQCLEVVLVDVSGKGLDAGTRSLQLSGAFGGLLGSLPTPEFLPAANQYVLRQEWAEGFATAVHLSVDLRSGCFEVRTAGHPPAAQFHAGSGRWGVHWTDGPVLGVIGAAEYSVYSGRLEAGDTLLLYTDGLVEAPDRDIAVGIDKLLGDAQRLVQHGFVGGAELLLAGVKSAKDDRALVLLHHP